MPIFLLALLLLSAVAARLVRSVAARWLSGAGGNRPDTTPPPSLGIPIGGAVLIGGLMLVLPGARRCPAASAAGSARRSTSRSCSRARSACRASRSPRSPSTPRAIPASARRWASRAAIVRIAVTVLAAIMALESLGVPVAPLLTTLGIGSLAVALALQDTLANFFAGLHLLADRPVRPGDYIKLHDGAEGFVETIGWRSSRLRTTANNIVVVPNQKLSQAILTNFHLPISNVTMTVALTVAADADADAVEKRVQRRARPRRRRDRRAAATASRSSG